MAPAARRGVEALVLAALAVLIVQGFAFGLPKPPLLFDFGSFIASGRAAGDGLDPYGVYPPLTFHLVLPGFESWNPNLNPPISLPLFQMIDAVEPDPAEALRLWWGVSFVLYVVAVGLLVRRHRGEAPLVAVVWAFALPGFWDTQALGQVYVPLVLAGIGGWLLAERGRWVAAGLLIGLVCAFKPNFLVWPGLLFLAGHRRLALASGAAFAGYCVLPVLIYGPGVYAGWFALLAEQGERAVFLTNASLAGLLRRAGFGRVGDLLGFALLAGLALWALRRRPSVELAGAVGLFGGVVASPIAWIHYTLFLLPVYFWAPRAPLLRLSGALLLVPVPFLLNRIESPPAFVLTVGSVYAWAVLLGLAGLLVAARERAAAAPEEAVLRA